jgi:uncharacterized membrane protein
MSKVPVNFVIAAFNNIDTAQAAADQIRYEGIPFRNLAVIRKTADSKVKIKESGDMSGGAGAGVGAVIGGALGLLAGPAGLAAGAAAGAMIGGAGAALHDAGIPDERLEQIGDLMKPESSALIAIFQEVKIDKETFAEIDQTSAEFVESLAEEIKTHLDAGQDVAFAALISEDGVAGKEVVVGDDATNIKAFAVTGEGMVAAEVVVTEDEVAYEVVAATENEAAMEAGVVTEDGAVIVDAAAVAEESPEEQQDESEAGKEES